MSDRSKVMTQTFRLGFGRGVEPHPVKYICYETSTKAWKWESKVLKTPAKEFGSGTRNVRTMLRIGSIG